MIEQRLKELKEVEKKAEEVITRAREEAEHILSTIPDERDAIIEKARTEIKKESDRIRSSAASIASKKAELARESLRSELKRLEEKSRKNFDTAVDFVVEWLLKKWDLKKA